MLLLLSNDDGIGAPGLAALAGAMRGLGEIVVVAPLHEQSATSHALTMDRPLRVAESAPGWFAVNGTPADCVYLGMHRLCGRRPDAVVSGVNRGANLGDDVHYSGTVAAAKEAALMGIPALAVSLHVDWRTPVRDLHFSTAAAVARQVVEAMGADPLPSHTFLNLNVPDVSLQELRGVAVTALGRHRYRPLVEEARDPRGRLFFWIGGPHLDFGDDDDCEGCWVERGLASLSPLTPDLTDRGALERIRGWKLHDKVP